MPRLPDLFEIAIAVGAVITVGGAIFSILYRVTRGNPENARLDALKDELEAENKKTG
jgi:ABC-type enterobactin transport system permease subunit